MKKYYPHSYKEIFENMREKRKGWQLDISEIKSEFDAYFIGLMITDGYVLDEERFGIDLTDEDCIAFISETTGKQYHTYEYKNHHLPRHRVIFNSKKSVEDLKRYGVIPKKSLIIQPPTLYKQEEVFIPYIIRGIIDGNGMITQTSYGAPLLRICSGSKPSILWMEKMLRERMYMSDLHIHEKKPEANTNYHSIWNIETALVDNLYKLQALSYNKPFGMDRKYTKLREMLRDYNRDNFTYNKKKS